MMIIDEKPGGLSDLHCDHNQYGGTTWRSTKPPSNAQHALSGGFGTNSSPLVPRSGMFMILN